ncbi:MAG: hypothetical protein GKR89_05320 [Candidatus Latescibacteria bacterium]|nr:hypothetical protein [Candidatus Latescibacterota bacterium]
MTFPSTRRLRTLLIPWGISALLGLTTCATADLRSKALKEEGPTQARSQRGQQLLQQAAQTHGHQAWRQYQTLEITLRDEWRGLLTKLGGRPWNKDQLLRFRFLNGSFNGRLDFVEGQRQGQAWGIQSWHTYVQKPGETDVTFKKHDKAAFFLPTYQYFYEFPFRILTAPIIAYLDQHQRNGRTYHRIFATWGKPEAHREHDQYIVWIDTKTHLIATVQYTVRDQFRFLKGAAHFHDRRPVGGVILPFSMTVTHFGASYQPGSKDFLHQALVEKARYDAFPPALLSPDPDKPFIGDAKVVTP